MPTFPYSYIPDPDKGRPLFFAKLYFGRPGLDPATPANQVSVSGLQEDGSTVALAQPIETGAGGVPLHDGSPVQLVGLPPVYSFKVLDRWGSQEYYHPHYERPPALAEVALFFPALDSGGALDLIAAETLQEGQFVQTSGYHAAGDGGGNLYRVVGAGTGSADGGRYIDQAASGVQLQGLFPEGHVSPLQFGAVGDGVTDDAVALSGCFAYAVSSGLDVCDYSGNSYLYASNITIAGAGKAFTLRTNARFVGSSATITIQGNLEAIGTISAAAAAGKNTFTCADAASLGAGDTLILWDSVASSFSQHRSNYYNGEFATVQSVSGTSVGVVGALLTSYDGVATDQVFRLNPIEVKIQGGHFESDAVFGLRIQYARGATIELQSATVDSDMGGAGLQINKSMDVSVKGGIYRAEFASASGTMYGIGIANSQNVTISSVDAYGYRHPVSTGGDAENGAAPCRFITVRDSFLANNAAASVYAADFHGNTANSSYENCFVVGSVGLAGSHVSCVGCVVLPHDGTNDVPLSTHEVVGGEMRFTRCRVYSPPTVAYSAIVGPSSSTLVDNVDGPYSVIVEDLYATINTTVTKVVNAYESSGQTNKWVLDGFNITGNLGGLTAVVAYTLAGGGTDAEIVTVNNPRSSFSVPFLSKSGTALTNTAVNLPIQYGSNANGDFVKLPNGTMICTYKYSASQAITAAYLGGFRTGALTWTYPATFTAAPVVSGVPTNGSALSVVGSGNTESALTFFLTAFTSQTATTRGADLKAIGRWY